MINKLTHHGRFPFVLKVRMRWSKNVLENYSNHPQILMRSTGPDFCVLLKLSLVLEQIFPLSNGQLNCFSASSKSAEIQRQEFQEDNKEISTHLVLKKFPDVKEGAWLA